MPPIIALTFLQLNCPSSLKLDISRGTATKKVRPQMSVCSVSCNKASWKYERPVRTPPVKSDSHGCRLGLLVPQLPGSSYPFADNRPAL